MRWILIMSVMASSAAVVAGCLVDSRCVADSDCEGFEQCNVTTGACELECSAEDTLACSGPRPHCLAEEFRCVACLEPGDCEAGEECVSNECVPGGAPNFALVDENTSSPTYGETYELASLEGSVVLLFFADLS